MAMKKTHDAVYAGEKYTDKDGNEKTRYVNVGVLFTRDDGSLTMKLEAIPVGFNGWINFYEPKPQEGGGKGERERPQRTGGGNARGGAPDDDIPFAPIRGLA
jgi:hypothetical protein